MLFSRIITVFILLIFLCETFDQGFIKMAFYINQNSIAKNLCENRNKPKMHCNGKCQLQKKINQNNTNKQAERKTESRDEVLSSKSFFACINAPVSFMINKKFFLKDINYLTNRSSSFFHPPQALFI